MTPNPTTDFFEQVFQVVRLIPVGRISTYGAIARYLGSAQSARMVGWAMNVSHWVSPPVPAHRVLNRMGRLTGKMHFEGPDAMQSRLEAEGVLVVDDQVQNMKCVFWDPSLELTL
ncbi:MAG: MGMT family protein [Sphingomonadales bacterium]|nr:MGMT family protein [Sphingomonadales bacterium]